MMIVGRVPATVSQSLRAHLTPLQWYAMPSVTGPSNLGIIAQARQNFKRHSSFIEKRSKT